MLASLEDWKTLSDIVASAATVAAIGIGAVWAYWRFVRERTRWPRALLELVVTHHSLSPERTLLNATVKVHNAGTGLMRLTGLRLYIYRVLPVRGGTREALDAGHLIPHEKFEADWPCIEKSTRKWETGRCPEIEPQENDEYVHDFLISSAVETVFIYAYIVNERRARGTRELGWQVTTFYDLIGVSGERHVDNVAGTGPMSDHDEKQQEGRHEPEPERIEEGQQDPRPEPERERPPAEPAERQQEPREEPRREDDED